MTKIKKSAPNSLKINLPRLLIGLDFNLRKTDLTVNLPDELSEELERLVDYLCTNCATEVAEGCMYFRSRINPLNEDRPIPNHQMGPPPAALAGNGRLAPAGTPILYLASDEETAIFEVRPFLKAIVSVAQFTIRETVQAIDFTAQPDPLDYEEESQNWDAIKMVQLSEKYFSAPAHNADRKAYLYTQYLISELRARGYDAFIYRSAQGTSGKNLALFDPCVAECGQVKTVRIRKVKYKFTPCQPVEVLLFPKTGQFKKSSPLM